MTATTRTGSPIPAPGKAADAGADAADLTCPACLGPGRWLSLVYDGRYRLCACRRCGTQYFRPDPALAPAAAGSEVSEYWEEYKFDLYADPAVRAGYEDRYARVLARATRAVGPIHSVLDIGCGIGNFVAYAAARGLNAYGVDVDTRAVAAARARGLSVAPAGEWRTLLADNPALSASPDTPTPTVDAVTLWDVIEHVYRPADLLADAVAAVRPGGAVLLETPDGGFPVRTALRTLHAATRGRLDLTGPLYYWEHKVYFTADGLRALLNRSGCDLIALRRDTSPRAKMQQLFTFYADQPRATLHERALAHAWPALERTTRTLGWGNKLLAVARRR